MQILTLLVAALIVESIWESLKMIWQQGKLDTDRIGSLVVGLVIAVAAQIDLLALVGVPLVNSYLGYVCTGILLSRGSNFVHDLMEKVSTISK